MGNKPYLKFEVPKSTKDKKCGDIYLEVEPCWCQGDIFQEKVFNEIEESGSLLKFIDYMNFILRRLNKIKYDYKSYIKLNIEKLLQNYKDKNSEIEKAFKNIDNIEGLKRACSLFKFIYSEKINIGKDKMNNFIETFNFILKKLDFLGNKKKEYIFTFLKDLFKVEEKEEEKEEKQEIVQEKEIPIKDDLKDLFKVEEKEEEEEEEKQEIVQEKEITIKDDLISREEEKEIPIKDDLIIISADDKKKT